MIVVSKKFGRQNSAYRHHIMKGASETERPSLFLQARIKTFQSKLPNPLSSARDVATFCAASPRTQAAAKMDSRESGDSRRLSSPAALRHAHASNSPLNIIGAGGNKVTQRRRQETGGSKKPAIHRTIVMIGACSAD
jgi:hypothetical protein